MSGLDNTSYTVRTSAVTTTATQTDSVILILAATGAVTVNLPAVATVQPGRSYTIYKDAAAQTITIDPAGSETVDGGATTTLISGQVHAKTVMTNGTAWFIVNEYDAAAA
jgi:hypothetical protein